MVVLRTFSVPAVVTLATLPETGPLGSLQLRHAVPLRFRDVARTNPYILPNVSPFHLFFPRFSFYVFLQNISEVSLPYTGMKKAKKD